MNIHKNARLSYARRVEMVNDIKARRRSISQAAEVYGVTPPTVRKWWGRYLAQGEAGLHNRSSRPKTSPRTIAPGKATAIVTVRLFSRFVGPAASNPGDSNPGSPKILFFLIGGALRARRCQDTPATSRDVSSPKIV